MTHRRRVVLLTVLAAQLGPTAGATPPPRIAEPEGPSAEACAQFGFRSDPEQQASPRYVRAPMPVVAPPVAYAPAPPPPPPPAPMTKSAPADARSRVEELVVTAQRRVGPGGAYRPAPAPVPQPQMRDTERYPGAVANPIKQVATDPVSTFSVDVDTAAYSNVRRFLNDGSRPPTNAVRVEELVNYFDYGYARPQDRATPFSSYIALAPSPWNPERQILHVGLQGFDLPKGEQPPLNLVFLIDTSGSMSSEDRLPLAQKSLSLLIDQLRPQDRVAMVAYAGSAGAVLAPTDGRQKLKMRCALGALHSGGSTAGGQGLSLAYALAKENFDPKAVNRVILVTDGDFNVGVADPSKLKDFVSEKRKDGVYLSVYGYGRGNYNDTMMQALARNSLRASCRLST